MMMDGRWLQLLQTAAGAGIVYVMLDIIWWRVSSTAQTAVSEDGASMGSAMFA